MEALDTVAVLPSIVDVSLPFLTSCTQAAVSVVCERNSVQAYNMDTYLSCALIKKLHRNALSSV